MWVRFTADHNFTPKEDNRVSIFYRAGMVENVRRPCADEAIALGRAQRCAKPQTEAGA